MLDALDESPRNGPRGDLLDTLVTMHEWSLQGLHLLFTSRDERDIRESFGPLDTQQVKMRNKGIDKDIANFISGRLDRDPHLQKWKKHRDKIQEALARRAQGMYIDNNHEAAVASQEYRLIS